MFQNLAPLKILLVDVNSARAGNIIIGRFVQHFLHSNFIQALQNMKTSRENRKMNAFKQIKIQNHSFFVKYKQLCYVREISLFPLIYNVLVINWKKELQMTNHMYQ